MDLSYFRRTQTRFASRSAAHLDYGVLVATLDAIQATSAAARALRSLRSEASMVAAPNPLVEILLGGPCWREAIEAQGGAFNRVQARRSAGSA